MKKPFQVPMLLRAQFFWFFFRSPFSHGIATVFTLTIISYFILSASTGFCGDDANRFIYEGSQNKLSMTAENSGEKLSTPDTKIDIGINLKNKSEEEYLSLAAGQSLEATIYIYEEFLRRFQKSEHLNDVQWKLYDCYQQQKGWLPVSERAASLDNLENLLKSIIAAFQNDKRTPKAYVFLGNLYVTRLDFNTAKSQFTLLKNRYPASDQTQWADLSLWVIASNETYSKIINESKDKYKMAVASEKLASHIDTFLPEGLSYRESLIKKSVDLYQQVLDDNPPLKIKEECLANLANYYMNSNDRLRAWKFDKMLFDLSTENEIKDRALRELNYILPNLSADEIVSLMTTEAKGEFQEVLDFRLAEISLPENGSPDAFLDFAKKHPDSKYTPTGLWRVAQFYEKEDSSKAIEMLRTIKIKYPKAVFLTGFGGFMPEEENDNIPISSSATLRIAYIYNNVLGDKNVALATLKNAIDNEKNMPCETPAGLWGELLPEALEEYADTNLTSGNVPEAIEYYKRVIIEFPNSIRGNPHSDATESYWSAAFEELKEIARMHPKTKLPDELRDIVDRSAPSNEALGQMYFSIISYYRANKSPEEALKYVHQALEKYYKNQRKLEADYEGQEMVNLIFEIYKKDLKAPKIVISKYLALEKEFNGTDVGGWASYKLGIIHLDNNDLQMALNKFNDIILRYPSVEATFGIGPEYSLKDMSNLRVAEIKRKAGDNKKADQIELELIKTNARIPPEKVNEIRARLKLD